MQSNIAGLQQPIRGGDTTGTTNSPVSNRLPSYTKGILPRLQSRAPRGGNTKLTHLPIYLKTNINSGNIVYNQTVVILEKM